MAEPEDTIDNIQGGPVRWWRFNDASGDITEQQGSGDDLVPVAGDSGAFNGTYQAETGAGLLGFGLALNGQGGLEVATGLTSTRGTMMLVARRTGTTTGQFWAGFGAGFDTDYCSIAGSNGTTSRYQIQDAGADDETWTHPDAIDWTDAAAHSLAVSPPAGTTGTPLLYYDGVEDGAGATFSGDDGVLNNYWWDSFGETVTVGMRTVVDDNEADNLIIFELLLWDVVLTSMEVSEAHDALFGQILLTDRNVRRRGRRTFVQ